MNSNDFGNVRVGDFKPPTVKLPPGLFTALPAIILVVFLMWSTVYTVNPEEVAVVLTFGEFTGVSDPGLHFKLPAPIQTYQLVPVQRQLKQEFGFRTTRAGVRSEFGASVEGESQMLTGDLNVAVVEWTTQYRVTNPELFMFRVRNVEETFRDMNEAVMRTVVGDRSVSEVLTVGRQEIASEVERRLQALCDQYETGIRIEQIVLQDVNPPETVKPSFNEVNQAQQERERLINEARSDFNREVPAARGEALRVVEQARGYAVDRVNRSEGDASRFVALYDAYRRAPEVTRRRLYLETMLELLPQVRQKIVIDQDIDGLMPLLNLQGEIVTPAAAAAAAQEEGQ
ncbi:MAG: FtsH protease activity modulator HflK [Acidobacteria bacterium]|nr:FtsH protease activity modulator HflK [Acidobacteriota bacterium]